MNIFFAMIEEITPWYVIYLGIFCDLKRACQMTIHLLKTGLLNEGRLHFLATLQNFLAKRRSGQTRPEEGIRIWVGKLRGKPGIVQSWV